MINNIQIKNNPLEKKTRYDDKINSSLEYVRIKVHWSDSIINTFLGYFDMCLYSIMVTVLKNSKKKFPMTGFFHYNFVVLSCAL